MNMLKKCLKSRLKIKINSELAKQMYEEYVYKIRYTNIRNVKSMLI